MGKSTGNSVRTTISEMADDVLKGVALLKSRKEIDAKHIGVIGHSEGGIIGPLAASRSSDISFVVMLGGTGVKGADVMTRQGELIMRAQGATDGMIARNRATQQMMFGVLLNNPDADTAALLAKLNEGAAQLRAGVPESQRQAGEQALRTEFSRILTPEMRTFITHDPEPVLRGLKVPVMAMNGSRDTQVDPKQNLPAIVNALTAGGNSDFLVMELPGLNGHLPVPALHHLRAHRIRRNRRDVFAPQALENLGEWLARHTGR